MTDWADSVYKPWNTAIEIIRGATHFGGDPIGPDQEILRTITLNSIEEYREGYKAALYEFPALSSITPSPPDPLVNIMRTWGVSWDGKDWTQAVAPLPIDHAAIDQFGVGGALVQRKRRKRRSSKKKNTKSQKSKKSKSRKRRSSKKKGKKSTQRKGRKGRKSRKRRSLKKKGKQ